MSGSPESPVSPESPESPESPLGAQRQTTVELRGFSLWVGDRRLLHETQACFPAGKVTLIVGCSGVGKSLLLRALAGLLTPDGEVRTEGTIEFQDQPDDRDAGKVGVVFQNFALFDELSPLANVRFAQAHAGRERGARPEELLDELHVPLAVRTSSLSGGQRQRLAIARTLAYDPGVLLYDEPTSGLDAATAERVARLIQSTQATHPKTSIVVTHDYEALSGIADRIYLLDSHAVALVEIPREAWSQLRERLQPPLPPADLQRTTARGDSDSKDQAKRGSSNVFAGWAKPVLPGSSNSRFATLAGRWLRTGGDLLAGTSRVAERTLSLPWNLLPLWRSPRWGVRFLLHYMRLVAGPSAWLYIAVAGAILGFVTTYFTFRFLPFARYTEPLLIEDLLKSMGFALYRILVPVLATILIAARCGAAVASDVGGKTYGNQIDALRSFGVRPARYLLTNILYAFLAGTPLLVLIGYLSASVTSLIVFAWTYPDYGPDFWQLHFHRRLVLPDRWWYDGTSWLLAKTLLCGLGIAGIAYYQGVAEKHSSREVSRGVTSTILWATLYVLVVQFVFAFYEF